MELRAHPVDNVGALLLGEVGWQRLDGFDKVVGLDPAIRGVGGGEDLEGGSGLLADDLEA